MTLWQELELLIRRCPSETTLAAPPPEGVMAGIERSTGLPIPSDIRDLLCHCGGISNKAWDVADVRFTGHQIFSLEDALPRAVDLCTDGYGNFFAADISSAGWGPVFFVCHDPAALVLRATDILGFLRLLFIGKKGRAARQVADDLPTGKAGMPVETALLSPDAELREAAGHCTPTSRLVDLRGRELDSGIGCESFSQLKRLGESLLFEVRPDDRPKSPAFTWLPWRRKKTAR